MTEVDRISPVGTGQSVTGIARREKRQEPKRRLNSPPSSRQPENEIRDITPESGGEENVHIDRYA